MWPEKSKKYIINGVGQYILYITSIWSKYISDQYKTLLAAVGFEPTPPKRLVPKTSALDRSATLPHACSLVSYREIYVLIWWPKVNSNLIRQVAFNLNTFRSICLFCLYHNYQNAYGNYYNSCMINIGCSIN